MNQPAEPGHGVLFTFHQRRAGEADIAGVVEHTAHPGCHEAVVGAMAFVHEHKDVAGGVFDLLPLDGIELVDDTGDDVRPGAVHQFHQMASARRAGGGQPGMGEGSGNLRVQLLAIRDDDHAGVAVPQLHQDILRQHDHGQALAAALRMPNDAALAVVVLVAFGDGLHDFPDGEELLIAADLLHVGVEENEIANQLEHALTAEQRDGVSVLFGGHAIRDKRAQPGLQPVSILLLPYAPELFGRAGCRVFDGVLVGRHDELREFEELRNICRLLVADHLPDGLFHGDMRGLALDDGKGNAIDEQHDVRAGVVLPVPAVHGELLRDVEHVVLRIVPVDILEVEAEHFSVADGLRVALAQQQRVVNLLAGAHEAVRQRFVQILHGALDVGGGKLVFRARIDIAVEPAELTAQDVPEQHAIPAAALLVAIRRGNVGVAHGLKQRKGRALACVDFQIGVFVHGETSFRKGVICRNSGAGGCLAFPNRYFSLRIPLNGVPSCLTSMKRPVLVSLLTHCSVLGL